MRIPRAGMVDWDQYLVQRCANKVVLNIGCTGSNLFDLYDGRLPHDLAHLSAREAVGLDPDGDRLHVMAARGLDNLVCSSVYDVDKAVGQRKFDLILCCDLLSRIQNPSKFLWALRRVCTPDTDLILTTSNAYALAAWFRCIAGSGSTQTEHVATYSYPTLRRLLLLGGFTVERWFVDMPKWHGSLSLMKRAVVALMPQFGDNLVAEVRRTTAAEDMGAFCPLGIAA